MTSFLSIECIFPLSCVLYIVYCPKFRVMALLRNLLLFCIRFNENNQIAPRYISSTSFELTSQRLSTFISLTSCRCLEHHFKRLYSLSYLRHNTNPSHSIPMIIYFQMTPIMRCLQLRLPIIQKVVFLWRTLTLSESLAEEAMPKYLWWNLRGPNAFMP